MAYSNMTFNVSAGLAFVTYDFVQVSHDANNYIIGQVVSYNSITGELIITPNDVVGSGTYNTWIVSLTGNNGTNGISQVSSDSTTSGTAGTSGTSASSGSSGTSATSGTSGTSGSASTSASSGSTGTAGSSGTTGESDSSGSSGTTGTSGTAGFSVLSGSSGTNGSSATSGESGTSATSGTSGSSASSGTSGLSRSSGVSGANGPIGAPGGQGPIGAQGPQGATGSSGTNGSSGATGPPGGQGPTGAQGPQGPTGAQGPQGAAGAQGPTGGPGPQGPIGTSASYSNYNGLNTNNSPVVFTNFAGAVAPTINYRTYFNNYKQFVQGANQGAGWTGFGPGWYTPASLGAASFYITSTRDIKTNIQAYAPSALDILKQTDIVSYNLEIEQCDDDKRIGFIAENTPEELATNTHNQMEIGCTLGMVLKAIQEIDQRVVNLQNKKNNAS